MTTTVIADQPANIAENPAPAVRVIFVEDDQDLRHATADYLRLCGFEVTDVASGLGFYKALSEEEFDIALLDVNLPDVSGYDLAREVSASRSLGVIMMTARTGRDDRIKGYEEGADLYMTKPVDGEELVAAISNLARRVRAHLTRKPIAAEPHYTRTSVAAWRLELGRLHLTSPQGQSISLSGRETILLEHLARSDGATLSRSAIDALFGHINTDPESRRIDASLRRLRLKAKEVGMELPLQIVHAVGVRFMGTLDVV